MSQFLGTHQNRLDAKGRVSVPSPFRAVLRAHAGADTMALVLRLSHTKPCIEAWPPVVFDTLGPKVEAMDVFSMDRDDLADILYGDAYPVEADKEGRIVVPERLIAHAALSDSVMFLGRGLNFEIWEPEAVERRLQEARERARSKGLTLGGRAPVAAAMPA